MKKTEIIEATLQGIRGREAALAVGFEDITSYERHVAAEIEKRLDTIEPDLDIPSCADFSHLGEECCPVCHGDYPDEMALIEIECGGRAWLCCSLDRALNPSKHAAIEESPEFQELVRLFNVEPVESE
jgi:hypothetical protein